MPQSNIKKFRVFKGHRLWADGLFIFDLGISFKEINRSSHTAYLQKEDYLGEMYFDESFLKIIQSSTINDKPYYYQYLF